MSFRNFLIFITSLTIFMAAACDNAGEGDGISGTYDLTGQVIPVMVIFHDTQAELRQAYRDITGNDDLVEQGFALMVRNPVDGEYCQMHMAKIRSIQDNVRINTTGHELLHCVLGSWHP